MVSVANSVEETPVEESTAQVEPVQEQAPEPEPKPEQTKVQKPKVFHMLTRVQHNGKLYEKGETIKNLSDEDKELFTSKGWI